MTSCAGILCGIAAALGQTAHLPAASAPLQSIAAAVFAQDTAAPPTPAPTSTTASPSAPDSEAAEENAEQAVAADSARPLLATGKKYGETLNKPISATWEGADLRSVLRRLGEQTKIAILLDRRLDPSATISASPQAQPLRAILASLAASSGGQLSVPEHVAYLGPESAAVRLRTLIAVRTDELSQPVADIPEPRRSELMQRETFAWNDLDTPLQLLDRIAARYGLEMQGREQVLHDLWAGGTLPQVSAAEALSLVLIQFDCSFVWTDGGSGVQIVPLPAEPVLVERSHAPPRGMTTATAIRTWRIEFPKLEMRSDKGQVIVNGTVEEHEALNGWGKTDEAPKTAAPPAGLDKKRFTLRLREAPVLALMQQLTRSADTQLDFEYDAEAFEAAGVDLSQRVTFEVKDATITQLLQAAFKPLGIEFELDGRTVRMKVRE